MQRATGLDDHGLNQLMKPIEAKLNAPWLKRDGARVVVIKPGESSVHEASPDELRDGIFFADYQAYREGRAA
jgi:hypothetical protein